MKVLAIDPGLNGAWAIYSSRDLIRVGDLPTTGEGTKRRVDAVSLALVPGDNVAFACVESVHAMPGQGVSSMFRFGQAFGTVLGVIGALGIPVRLITPQSWKAYYGLRSASAEDSRQKAIDLIPAAAPYLQRKKDHNRAEALLMALYGALEIV